MQQDRRPATNRRVRAFPLVGSTPILQLFVRTRKGQEPVRVQALRSELAVEGLDEAVIGRFSEPREVQGDIAIAGMASFRS